MALLRVESVLRHEVIRCACPTQQQHLGEYQALQAVAGTDIPGVSENIVTGLHLDRLVAFMLAMPRDKLLSFTSEDYITGITLRIVLRSQRKLKELSFSLHDGLSEPDRWLPCLSALTKFTLWVPEDAVETAGEVNFYQPLLQQSPKLTSLVVSALEPFEGPAVTANISLINLPTGPSEVGKFDLESLRLINVDLGKHYARLSNHVNLAKLAVLELVHCLDPQPIIRMLARTFIGGACDLEGLSICLASRMVERTDGSGVRGDIEALLLSFHGLKPIFVDMTRYGLLSKDCIIHHARTLETWGIGADKQLQAGTNKLLPVVYGASDLTDILRSCESLNQLAIPLGIDTVGWQGLCHDVAKLDVVAQD